MKTLLFCTAYADSQESWNGRVKSWYQYYKPSKVNRDQILVIDDGSPCRPDFISEEEFKTFQPHFGKLKGLILPGWFRSFSYAGVYAQDNKFEKIIHLESDAYLLTDRIIDFVNGIETGWHTMWCPRHGMPEPSIQIICKDQFVAFNHFFNVPYGTYAGVCIDGMLPYTQIHHEFVGDRYGEVGDEIPHGVDFCCQTSSNMINRYSEKPIF